MKIKVLLFLLRLLPLSGATGTSRSEQEAGNKPINGCEITASLLLVLPPQNSLWAAGDVGLGEAESALEMLCSPGVMSCSSSSSVGSCLLRAFGGFFTLCSARFVPVTVLF